MRIGCARGRDCMTRGVGGVREGRCLGLPVTVKSSIATRGLKCEIGSLLHKDELQFTMRWRWRGCAQRERDSGHDELSGVPDGV